MKKSCQIFSLIFMVFLLSVPCKSEEFTLSHKFKSGELISSDDMNQNFDELAKAINTLHKKLRNFDENLILAGTQLTEIKNQLKQPYKLNLILDKHINMSRKAGDCADYSEILIVNTGSICAVSGMGGKFSGGGENFKVQKRNDGTWFFTGRSCQPGVQAHIICFEIE